LGHGRLYFVVIFVSNIALETVTGIAVRARNLVSFHFTVTLTPRPRPFPSHDAIAWPAVASTIHYIPCQTALQELRSQSIVRKHRRQELRRLQDNDVGLESKRLYLTERLGYWKQYVCHCCLTTALTIELIPGAKP